MELSSLCKLMKNVLQLLLFFVSVCTALEAPATSHAEIAKTYVKHLEAYNKDLDFSYWLGKKLLSKELEALCVKSKKAGDEFLFVSSDSIPGFAVIKTEFSDEIARIQVGHKEPDGTLAANPEAQEVLILILEGGSWRLDDIHFMEYDVEGKEKGRFHTLRDQVW